MVQLISIAAVFLMLLPICMAGDMAPRDAKPDIVLATLGGGNILESDFEQFVQDSYPPSQVVSWRLDPAAHEAALESFLNLRVMVAKAHKDGIDQHPTFKKAVELMDMKLLVGLLNEDDRERFERLSAKDTPASDTAADLRQRRIESLRKEMGFTQTELAFTNVSLLDTDAIAPEAILATVGGVPLREADFQWFIKDAFRREQRQRASSRPDARRNLLASFLDFRLLEAKARKDGLDKTPVFIRSHAFGEMRLLAEFLRERDHVNPWQLPGETEAARMSAFEAYLSRLRVEMGLQERLDRHVRVNETKKLALKTRPNGFPR